VRSAGLGERKHEIAVREHDDVIHAMHWRRHRVIQIEFGIDLFPDILSCVG